METPRLLMKPRRPALPSTKLIESLIANKKPLNPHPLCSRSSSIRALKTSQPKSERSCSETRKAILTSAVPSISSSSWCVSEGHTGRVLYGFRDIEVKEIASLTKIMTCYVSLKLIYDKICSFEDIVKVSNKAAKVNGTSAELRPGDNIALLDLLYGLMLPSGNDAAWALAEHFGKALNPSSSKPTKEFILEMNKHSRIMGLYTTYFANPHGLIYKKNVSCARDICKLCTFAMKDIVFRKIVSTKVHLAEVNNEEGGVRRMCWENTNKLLARGFEGIKTGVTDNAGPCLATGYRGRIYVIVILLNCKSLEARWEEAQTLVNWVMNFV